MPLKRKGSVKEIENILRTTKYDKKNRIQGDKMTIDVELKVLMIVVGMKTRNRKIFPQERSVRKGTIRTELTVISGNFNRKW